MFQAVAMKKDLIMRQSSSAKRTTESSLVEVSSFQHAAVSQRVVSTPQSLQAGAGREIGKPQCIRHTKATRSGFRVGSWKERSKLDDGSKANGHLLDELSPVSLSLTYERAEVHAWEP